MTHDDSKTLSLILEHLAALNQWTQNQDELHLKEQMDELTSLTRSLMSSADSLAKTSALAAQNEKNRALQHKAQMTALNDEITRFKTIHERLYETTRDQTHKLQNSLHKALDLHEKQNQRSPLAATIQSNSKPIAAASLIASLALLSLFALMFFYIPRMNTSYVTMTSEQAETLHTEASHGRIWIHYLRSLPKEQADPLFSMVRNNHPPTSHPLCLTTTPPSSSDESSSNSSSKNSDSNESSSKKSAKRKP